MDKTVPRGAALLLDFIREIEVGRTDRASYDVVYGHNQAKLPKPLTSMTVDEVIAAGSGWTKAWRSSAAGGYQFMRDTLKGLKSELGLLGSQVFSPDLQDRLGYHLLKRRGYVLFMAGSIDRTEFAKRLAMEWASLPVLVPTQGRHRRLKRGQSYYTGDALNKALVAPERIEALLDRVRDETRPVPEPSRPATPRDPPTLPPPAAGKHSPSLPSAGILGAIAALVLAFLAFLFGAS